MSLAADQERALELLAGMFPLSDRELEVARLMARGWDECGCDALYQDRRRIEGGKPPVEYSRKAVEAWVVLFPD